MKVQFLRVMSVIATLSGLATIPVAQVPETPAQIQIARAGSRPSTTAPAANFTGSVRIEPVFQARPPARAAGSLVTFEPGARTAWHSHPMGQTLIVKAGRGRVQRWGEAVDEIGTGDVVWIPAGQKHWHGASPDSSMSHIAISEPQDGKTVDWLEKVSDEQYGSPLRGTADASKPTRDEKFKTSDDRPKAGLLTPKQRRMAAISAFTANGDLDKLRGALNDGLDGGLTVNETKEILIHLYAYAGFPRSLQGLNTLISVIDERRKRGVSDLIGRDASPVSATATRYERGRFNLEKLTGRPEPAQKPGYAMFAPVIEVFLKEHLFADIFDRDLLGFADREVATISALVALGGVEPMMQNHMTIGLNVGLSDAGLNELLSILENGLGRKKADKGRKVLAGVIAAAKKK